MLEDVTKRTLRRGNSSKLVQLPFLCIQHNKRSVAFVFVMEYIVVKCIKGGKKTPPLVNCVISPL